MTKFRLGDYVMVNNYFGEPKEGIITNIDVKINRRYPRGTAYQLNNEDYRYYEHELELKDKEFVGEYIDSTIPMEPSIIKEPNLKEITDRAAAITYDRYSHLRIKDPVQKIGVEERINYHKPINLNEYDYYGNKIENKEKEKMNNNEFKINQIVIVKEEDVPSAYKEWESKFCTIIQIRDSFSSNKVYTIKDTDGVTIEIFGKYLIEA